MWDSKKMERSRNVTFDEGCFSRGHSRHGNINPNLSLQDYTTDVFPDNVSNVSNNDASLSSGTTTTETNSNIISHDSSVLRRSHRLSTIPKRLTDYKLGFLNSNNIWNTDTILFLDDYVHHIMITVNNTPMS